VDVLLFNPPYVPTPDEEVARPAAFAPRAAGGAGGAAPASAGAGGIGGIGGAAPPPIVAAWAGGERGRRVIDRALPQIAAALSRPAGVAYVVLVDDNDPAGVAAAGAAVGLAAAVVARVVAKNESLLVMRLSHARG
jgi:release factor glutamine methyltransferase